jgi:uncharacterized integral membrane protein
MKLFFIYCLIAVAGASFVTFYRSPDAWHALVIGIYFFLLALFILRNKEPK